MDYLCIVTKCTYKFCKICYLNTLYYLLNGPISDGGPINVHMYLSAPTLSFLKDLYILSKIMFTTL